MVCSRCSSNLYPPQPGTSTAARNEPSAGTHQALRRTPSVLLTSISSYPSPTNAGVATGDLRSGEVIQSTTSNPTTKYPRDRVTKMRSMRRSIVLTCTRVLEDNLHRRRTGLLAERDGECATFSMLQAAFHSVD